MDHIYSNWIFGNKIHMISAQQIKELRVSTGAGISDIKHALAESGGDMGQARVLIEEKFGQSAGKRSGRDTGAGVMDAYIHSNARLGVLVEILCETDFVARNPEFKGMVHDIAMHIAASDPADAASLLSQPFIKDERRRIGDLINDAIGRFGENIKVGRFARFEI